MLKSRIKRSVAVAAIAVAGLAGFAGEASAVQTYFHADFGNVNIRSGPGTGYSVITLLVGGSAVASAPGTVTGGAYSCFGFSGVKWRPVYPSAGNGYVGSACGNNY